MLHWAYRITPVAVALMLLPAAAAAQANEAASGAQLPAIETKLQHAKTQVLRQGDNERQQRVAIAERANNVFTLLASEMVLDQGQVGSALATYMVMLERTRDPEVAERGMEIALNADAVPQAQAILTRWQQLEPTPSAAQKRMVWEMALAQGDVGAVAAGLDDVLADASDYKTRRIFLQMAQMSLRHPELAADAAAPIHKAAQNHADMPEAMIADAIFSAQSNRSQDAVSALQKLAELDGDVRPPTLLTLKLINQYRPQVLVSFFKQTDINALPPMWQSLYVDTLISSKQWPQAYAWLQKLLTQSPDADLYLQAAVLSVSQQAPTADTLGYLDKAYAIGTQAQKSRAAFLAASRLMDDEQTALARKWAEKITAADMAFDKQLLLTMIAAEDKNWAAASRHLDAAAAISPQVGQIYDSGDLWRLRLFVIGQYQTPAQKLASYNRLLAQAEKATASPERTERIAEVLYERGIVYANDLNQPQRAVADLRRFVAMKPNSPDGLNALGYTMLSLPKSEWPEAMRLIEEAYQLDSQSAPINDSLGWAYFLKGDAEAALPYLQFAYDQIPDAEVAAHLGEVLWTLGRQEEARQVWRTALQQQPQHRVLRDTLRRLGVTNP